MNITAEEIEELKNNLDWKHFSGKYLQKFNPFNEREVRATREQLLTYFLWRVMFEREQMFVVAFEYQRQSVHFLQEFYDKYESLAGALGKFKPELTHKVKTWAQFDSGTRILTASNECHLRGIAISTIAVYDQLDMVKWKYSVFPGLTSNSKWIEFS